MPIKVEVDVLQKKVYVWQVLDAKETRNYCRELRSAKFWYDTSMKKWSMSLANWEELSMKCLGKCLHPNSMAIDAVINRCSDNPRESLPIYPGIVRQVAA
jgi:hypothetical protein